MNVVVAMLLLTGLVGWVFLNLYAPEYLGP